MITYKPLLKLLIDKNLKKYDLIPMTGISSSTLAKLSSDSYVSLEVIDKLCKALGCQPGDLMEYVSD